MTPALVAVALIVVAGAVVAVSAREVRFAALGLVVAILGAAYVSDPLPGMTALAGRLVGAVLGGFLVWVSLRDAPASTAGSHLGWPGAAAIAMAGFAAGWLSAGAVGGAVGAISGEGPSAGVTAAALVAGSPVAHAALGAAFALVALAAAPVLVSRDVLRLGLGLLLMLAAAELMRNALAGPADDAAELAFGILFAAGGAAVAALVGRSLRANGDLVLRSQPARETAVRSRVADDAHPVAHRR